MKFTLEITLGNAAVISGEDIAALLLTVSQQVNEYGGALFPQSRTIRDLNGTTVGHWEFTEE